MKHHQFAWLRTCMAAGPLAVLLTLPSMGQQVTGQWDFNDGNLAPTVGAAGEYWIAPTTPSRDVETETQFGTTTSFSIADIAGQPAKVMRFPRNDRFMGYAMYPEIDANGGGLYVNQYTVVMDILYPASSTGYRALFQTNECNNNDGDIFLNGSNGIGISGDYVGTVLPDTWHRVAFSIDLAAAAGPTLAKYIDGVQVGTQILGEGVDQRWSLYTKTDDLPALLFTDEDNETGVGYVNSIQVRNYAMPQAEVEALGGPSAAGIPGDAGMGVTGQWDFESGNLAATIGRSLVYFKGCLTACAQDLAAATEFGPASTFGVPPINEVDPEVMKFPATYPCTSFLFPHGAAPNGDSTLNKVNQYSLIMDVYFKAADYVAQPPPFDNDWISLYTSYPLNDADSILFIRGSDGALGDDGDYGGTEASCPPDQWLRIAIVIDTSTDRFSKYVNGVFLATQSSGPVDDKRALFTKASEVGRDFLLLFADNDYETKPGYVNSIQFRDYAMTDEEVAELGGPTAAGIGFLDPPLPRKAPDVDKNGYVDQEDLEEFLACVTGPAILVPVENDLLCRNFDVDKDNDIDQEDFGVFQQFYTGIMPCAPNCFYP